MEMWLRVGAAVIGWQVVCVFMGIGKGITGNGKDDPSYWALHLAASAFTLCWVLVVFLGVYALAGNALFG